jgi:predicted metalloprotease with PDZ domain
MKTLINLAKKDKRKLTLDKLNQIAKKYHKANLLEDIHTLYLGKLLISNPDSFGSCVYQTIKMLAPYSRGFDIQTSKKVGIIASVKPESRAFTAGLRDGKQLISIEEHPDDISRTMSVTVKDNGITKVIKYYPYEGELRPIPQFILDQSKWKTQGDKCLDWFMIRKTATY